MDTEVERRSPVSALMSRWGIEAILLLMTLSTKRSRAAFVVLSVAALALMAGCASAAVDKQGAPAVTVLRVGTADPADGELAYFVEAVARNSERRLRVEIDAETYFSETPGGEAKLVGDLQAGMLDLAFIPSRDWAAAGDTGFQAVQAPFLIGTTAATVALVGNPLVGDLLGGLDAAGVVGLALVPGQARRLIARAPVTNAADLAGKKVRINDNVQAAQLMAALGATGVQGVPALQTRTDLATGAIDAVETAPTYAASNQYHRSAPYVSSFGMFPKLQVLAAAQQVWDELADADQFALQAAAADTVSHASMNVPAQEETELSQLCAQGAVIIQPEDAALDDLIARAAPAQPTDPSTRQMMARISAAVGGTGVSALSGPLPAPCRVASTVDQARALHEEAGRAATSGQVTNQAFPTGTFEVTVTAEQWAAAGIIGSDWKQDTTFIWTLTPEGGVKVTQQPDFPDQGPATGTWVADGDHITFTLHQGVPDTLFVETVRWSYFEGVLHFVVVSVLDEPGRVIYATPWRKVG